jgi:hypothetical protein
MSSEWFTYASNPGLHELVERWALPQKRQVIVVIRSASSHARSHWMQNVKMGFLLDDYETYVKNNYLSRRAGPLSQLLPWVESGFYPIVINYEAMKAAEASIDCFFLEAVYGNSIDVKDWAELKTSSNISPDINTLDKFRRIDILFRHHLSGSGEVSGNHSLLHDKMCKILGNLDRASPDSSTVALLFRKIATQFTRHYCGNSGISGDYQSLQNETCKIIEDRDQCVADSLSAETRQSLADLEAEDISELHKLDEMGKLVGFSL